MALASYHFGTKENLFEEVVARRAAEPRRRAPGPAGRDRDAHDPRRPRCLHRPAVRKGALARPGLARLFRVLARLGDGTEWLHLLHRYFDPTGQRFIEALLAAAPGAERAAMSRGFAMILHAMLAVVSQNGRVSTLTDGAVKPDDLDAAYGALLDFSTAGLEAPVPTAGPSVSPA
ncbi:MAG: hypothetical protein R3D80_10520 [Paracoccaceae bacterium]